MVIGLQYGDEGKGKITDVLARQTDWVIRFNGGNNAGHTLWLNGKKLVTHSVPSGVLSSHAKNYIGAGCVVDPIALKKELAELKEAGAALNSERLYIDYRAHVILPLHRALDSAREAGPQGIGTTKRGIGPTYSTKMDRLGLRVGQSLEADAEKKVEQLCATYNPLLKSLNLPESTLKENLECLEIARELFRPHLSKEASPFYDISKNKKCVLEGAQGVLLDLDHGSYPYVTSSNTIAGYASVGTPFPFSKLGIVFGVAKAYLTRVGQGPFPTELSDDTGERIRRAGHEFGATTGRPRRTGWLNVDELLAAVRLTDCSAIVLTKADVLMKEAQVFALFNGKLESFAGWTSMTVDDKMHPNLEKFIQAVEAFTKIPVVAVGTGPDRADLFWRKEVKDFWSDLDVSH